MLSLLLSCLLLQTPAPAISRDGYGVPHIKASSQADAFFQAGYASAQDRLWQMETSRRVARGRMAEAFGSSFVAADKEQWLQGYTDDELRAQFNELGPETQRALEQYVRGVNAYIEHAKKAAALPKGYEDNELVIEPWTLEDSLSIGVLLMRQFGRFGAGELRNMAMLAYLEAQPKARERKLDIFDDFVWQNDPQAFTTVPPEEDPVKETPTIFPPFDRTTTEAHLAKLPQTNMLELMPGLRIAEMAEQRRVAEMHASPFKAGSYAVVDTKATSGPILLSGPQMGFTTPSIVYELSIDAPGYQAAGVTVPGLPFVAVGTTPRFAWALTSGVADTDDVFFYKAEGADGYLYGTETKQLQRLARTLKKKGAGDEPIEQRRTLHGPVILKAGGHYFVRRAASWMSELHSLDSVMALGSARTPEEIEGAMKRATVNFNFFYGTPDNQTGYRYVGRVPLRAAGLDPRLPTPGEARSEWKGFVPWEQMPHARNTKIRPLLNWNNKPVAWWPNGDTPTWGRVFRVSSLADAAGADVEKAAWTIARRDETFGWFKSHLPATGDTGGLKHLRQFDGMNLANSVPAGVYQRWFEQLRSELFQPTTGTFVSPELFRLAAQPSVMLAALEGRTKVDYLQGRTAGQVGEAALQKVASTAAGDWNKLAFKPATIPVPDEPPIPYRNRGTYIQIAELTSRGVFARNVLPPGNSESGAHSRDQVKHAREWTYKPMKGWPRR